MAWTRGYGQKCPSKGDLKRFSLRIHSKLLDDIDTYGIPAGFRSRNEAIIRLIEVGILTAEKTEEAKLGGTSSPVSE